MLAKVKFKRKKNIPGLATQMFREPKPLLSPTSAPAPAPLLFVSVPASWFGSSRAQMTVYTVVWAF